MLGANLTFCNLVGGPREGLHNIRNHADTLTFPIWNKDKRRYDKAVYRKLQDATKVMAAEYLYED